VDVEDRKVVCGVSAVFLEKHHLRLQKTASFVSCCCKRVVSCCCVTRLLQQLTEAFAAHGMRAAPVKNDHDNDKACAPRPSKMTQQEACNKHATKMTQ